MGNSFLDTSTHLVLGWNRTVEALKRLELAAAQGHSASMHNIADIRNIGGIGVPQDDQKAFEWLRKAADAGYEYSIYCAGLRYYNGQGVAKDLVEARTWFQKGSDSRIRIWRREFMFMPGFMMMRGEGGLKLLGKGMTLVETAAEEGYDQATQLISSFGTVLFVPSC